jgi:hypothetical protein
MLSQGRMTVSPNSLVCRMNPVLRTELLTDPLMQITLIDNG